MTPEALEQLKAYVAEQLKAGASEAELREAIKKEGGWSDEDLVQVFPNHGGLINVPRVSVETEPATNNPFNLSATPTTTTPNRNYTKIILAALGVTLTLGGLFLAFKFELFSSEISLAAALDQSVLTEKYHSEVEMNVEAGGLTVLLKQSIDVDNQSGAARVVQTYTSQALEFSNETIVIGDDVYIKGEVNQDSLLGKAGAIVFPDSWLHLNANQIPDEYKQFVSSGNSENILASLHKLKDNLSEVSSEKVIVDGREYSKVRVIIKNDALASLDEQLSKIIDGSGETPIEIWINSDTRTVERVEMETDSVSFKVAISNKLSSEIMLPPESSVTLAQWELEKFHKSLQAEKVSAVYLAGYGGVKSETMSYLKQVIESELNVPVTIGTNYAESFPKDPRAYNEERGQFDADLLWAFLGSDKEHHGNTVRFIVLINEDLFTKIQPDRPYVLNRSLPEVNTIVLATKRLQNVDENSELPAPEGLFNERLRKIALRALGVTVGFNGSPEVDNKDCLMYQALTVEELDSSGASFCEITKTAIPLVFGTASSSVSN